VNVNECLRPLGARVALFLDVDGTLLAFVDHPDDVEVRKELIDVLALLYRKLDSALALVSGRSIESLDAIFAPLVLPAAGLHGLERRDARGDEIRVTPAKELAPVRERFSRFVDEHPGSLIEDKNASLALHFRRVPAAAGEARRLEAILERELPDTLQVQPGKMVLEVRPRGETKGSAIAAFMREAPFAGRTPVFLGDDVTDEDGFRFVNESGGVSIKVGPGDSTAAFRLEDAGEVSRWLESWSRRLPEGE
jgi:trehalose 6-phosphate phosphatase